MPIHINATTSTEGWLFAMEHLLEQGGQDTQVAILIQEPLQNSMSFKTALDNFLAEYHGEDAQLVDTVANTIFPVALSVRSGLEGRQWLYAQYQRMWPVLRKIRANERGTYFNRLIAYPGNKQTLNQVESVITRMQAQLQQANPKHAAYELSIRVEDKDRSIMGFPCLSHISLTLIRGRLNLTAIYRNQHFVRKAFGNYLGLSRLLTFISREVGVGVGSLLCVAAHADAEISEYGKRRLQEFITIAKKNSLQENVSALWI